MIKSALCKFVTSAHQAVPGDIVEKPLVMRGTAPGELDFHLAVLADVLDAIPEQAGDMGGSEGAAMVTTALASGICPAAARMPRRRGYGRSGSWALSWFLRR
jgi:hypothetical protein